MFSVKMLADSKPDQKTYLPNTVHRLMTMEMTYPRFVHAEHLRHRMFSFNVSSSRAIPIARVMADVDAHPVLPIHYGAAQKGMQASNQVDRLVMIKAESIIDDLRRRALAAAHELNDLGLHKQVVNRYLEPWAWVTVICTGTLEAWNNFWNLRCHADAEPHIRRIAELSELVAIGSEPRILCQGDVHLPMYDEDDDPTIAMSEKIKVAVGRLARVSYCTHDGRRDPAEDIALHDRLEKSKHFSPFEHVATLDMTTKHRSNFTWMWHQYRKTRAGEYQNERPDSDV